MRTFFLLLFSCGLAQIAQAQQDSLRRDTTYWQKSFSGAINFNQSQFNNWSGGGVNSLSVVSFINARALYQKDKWCWDNTTNLQLGYTAQDVDGRRLVRKAADQLLINSVVSRRFARSWETFFSANFNSFFASGFRYEDPRYPDGFKVSQFLAPGQLTLAWGLAFKPNPYFSLYLSPFSPRFTFLAKNDVRFIEFRKDSLERNPEVVSYGVQPGQLVYREWLAAQVQAVFNKNLDARNALKAEYFAYYSYEKALSQTNHRFNLLFTSKFTRLISLTFNLNLLYNPDYSDRLQIQQSLGIGLLYNVSTFKTK